jgi:2-polyprenyl-6-hydroxyphenyl methylase/3-demethylubiquinone-9 3-methyltransferase
VLRWVPTGTHDWRKFITPKELRRHIAAAGLDVTDVSGMVYNPVRDDWRLSTDTGVNYWLSATKPGAPAAS